MKIRWNIKKHDANNANNSLTYFLTIAYMTNGIIELIKGNNNLKRIWGSMFKKFSNMVGNMEIPIDAFSNNVGSGIQTELINVV